MTTRYTRTAVWAAALAAVWLSTVAPPAGADQSITVPIVHLEGRGHGHGVGMSQWGAFTMAGEGASATEILDAFYPGTSLATRGGEVVVVVDRRDHLEIELPGGGEIRSPRTGEQHPGFPVRVTPGSTVEIVREAGGYRVGGGSVAPLGASSPVRYSSARDCVLILCTPEEEPPTTTEPPPGSSSDPPATTDPPDRGDGEPPPERGPPQPTYPISPGPVWAVPAQGSAVRSVDRGRSYRGVLEAVGEPGQLRLRNHVDVEDYLKGMAEVPGTWPAAAVQAQAIAARTYALRAMASDGELCDSESCQVYAGTAQESPGQVAAVDATRHVVVTHGGHLAATFYSASGGGFSANVVEGFGTPSDIPYLRARPYRTVRPEEWTVDIALTDVAQRMGYPGTITSVRIDETGPSGRALRMALDGDAGTVPVDPQDFRRSLGLRSTLFEVATTRTSETPAPPPEEPDVGVVGAVGPDVELAEPEVYAPARPAGHERAPQELAAGDTGNPHRFPSAAAGIAFVLLLAMWTVLTLRAMTCELHGRITMVRWMRRSR